MTREEKAIIYFKDMRKRMCEDYLNTCPKDSVAYMATLAEKDFYDTAIKALEQELCEDAISRQAVLKIYDEWFATCNIADKKESPKNKIKALPSVTPQPKIEEKT